MGHRSPRCRQEPEWLEPGHAGARRRVAPLDLAHLDLRAGLDDDGLVVGRAVQISPPSLIRPAVRGDPSATTSPLADERRGPSFRSGPRVQPPDDAGADQGEHRDRGGRGGEHLHRRR